MDELTALRRLDADTPAPSEAALTRALAALTDRMDAAEPDTRPRARTTPSPWRSRPGRSKRAPIWTTAVVAAGVAVVAVLAIQSAPTRSGGDIGAPAASPSAAITSAPPTSTPTPTATAAARPDYEYDLNDAHDVARANAELACYRSHGVRIVGLTKPDKDGIAYIEYGGAHNDQRSITLGLDFQRVCTAVGDAAR